MALTFVEAMEQLNARVREVDARRTPRTPVRNPDASVVHEASLRLLALAEDQDDRELADALHSLAHRMLDE